ncbi:energy transducer TonB [Hymenobacter negativus]|uniref:TonB family protein n=1 Tax=Hymenobacter negativus TaxID=2795026 RepID=A0ABS3QJI6_9BACT|nr:energy transducer TonB [Hymenobacter negativus]MBO2011153.1 TonB family protein [Hymenobacter negativus]
MIRFTTTAKVGLLVGVPGATLALAGPARAQEQAAQPARPVKIEYFDETRFRLPSEAGADYRTETAFRDSVSGMIREYYLPSGKLKDYTPYANLRRKQRHGTSSQYYESGQLREQVTYQAGKMVGDLVTYYPDGNLKRRDHHTPGQPTTGECFGADGKPRPYFNYHKMPVYTEGDGDQAAVVNAVMRNTQYPREALRQRVYGIVKILFVVDKHGLVQHIRPDEKTNMELVPENLVGTYRLLQEAAMEAVRKLKPFQPGQQDGEPVPVSYSVPVTFRIR